MYAVIRMAATPISAPLMLFHSSSVCSRLSTPLREADLGWSSVEESNACPSRRAEDRRQERTPGNRPSEKHVRSRAKLLAPIGSGVDPIFQFSEIGAESVSSPIDLRLYFVGCFIHSRFSWSDSIVRSGIGLIRVNLRSPVLITMPPAPAIATAITSVAAHIGRTVARA